MEVGKENHLWAWGQLSILSKKGCQKPWRSRSLNCAKNKCAVQEEVVAMEMNSQILGCGSTSNWWSIFCPSGLPYIPAAATLLIPSLSPQHRTWRTYASFSMHDKGLCWWLTSPWVLPIDLVKTFLEMCCSLPNPCSFPFSFAGGVSLLFIAVIETPDKNNLGKIYFGVMISEIQSTVRQLHCLGLR